MTATLGQVALYLNARPIAERITIVYHDPGACQGYQEYLDDQITTAGATIKYWIPGSTAAGSTTCTLAVPHSADFAHMGNPHDFCGLATEDLPQGYPTGYGTVQAPIQTLNIIADKDSSQRSISAEALYYIYGLGGAAAGVEPWNEPTNLVFRQTSSFVHQFVAQSIFGDDNRQFYDDPGITNQQGDGTIGNGRLGYEASTNGQVVTRVAFYGNSGSAEHALGFVSGSAAESETARTQIKTLAYQHYDQERGYWPDSTESTKDKRNVRSGKYHFWSPGHFYARVADDAQTFGNGDLRTLDDVLDADVRRFLSKFTTTEDEEVVRRIIAAGDVPLCASQVTREGLDGPISSYAPEDPCNGFFELVSSGNTNNACGGDDECGGDLPKCRHGFCEAY